MSLAFSSPLHERPEAHRDYSYSWSINRNLTVDPEKDACSRTISGASTIVDGPFVTMDPMTGTPSVAAVSKTTTAQSEKFQYPEGGFKAWSVVLGSWMAMVASFGIMNTIGAFQTYVSSELLTDLSEGTIGWIFSLYVFLAFFGGIWIGPIFDAWGPRWLIAIGSLLLEANLLLLGLCKEYYQFMLVFSVIGGIAASLLFTPSVAVIGHYFLIRRGLASGLAATGGSIGGIAFPLLVQGLTPKLGFAWTTRIMALICGVLLIGANILIRGRQGELSAKAKRPSISDMKSLIDVAAFKDVRFLLTTVGVFLLEWGIFVPLTYLTIYALRHHMRASLAYQLLAILNAGSFFGRWLPGLFSDKVGRFNTMIVISLFCMVITFALWLPSRYNQSLVIAYAALYGFGSGSGISLTPVCVGQICSTGDYGKRYGTCYFFVSFGTLTGIPIAGSILNAAGDNVERGFTGLIVFTGACYIGALIFFILARGIGGGWQLRKRF